MLRKANAALETEGARFACHLVILLVFYVCVYARSRKGSLYLALYVLFPASILPPLSLPLSLSIMSFRDV